jgi:hypothetical protein
LSPEELKKIEISSKKEDNNCKGDNAQKTMQRAIRRAQIDPIKEFFALV